jgi:N utilization substance protein A
MALPGVGISLADALYEKGFYSAEEIGKASVEDLLQVRGIDEEMARGLIEAGMAAAEQAAQAEADEAAEAAQTEADEAAKTAEAETGEAAETAEVEIDRAVETGEAAAVEEASKPGKEETGRPSNEA